MRLVLKTLLALGVIMMMGAFFVAVDQFATDERKEAFNQSVDSVTDAMAETPDTNTDCRRCGKGLWASIQALANGIMRSTPVVLDDIMPPAPEGWVRTEYVVADGETLTGESSERSYHATHDVNRVLTKFAQAAKAKSLGSAMTYTSGDRIVLIRMQSKLDHFRKADAGTYEEKRKMLSMKRPPSNAKLFMTVDGHPIGVLPQFTRVQDRRYPTEYRRFVFSIGHIVEGEMLAIASDADLMEIFGSIDFAAVQAVLDEPTDRFVLGKGVEWAGDTLPSSEVPPLTIAYRAHLLLREEGGLERDDFETLKAIARGQVSNWDDMAEVFKASHSVSPDIIELLGEEPHLLSVARAANLLLLIEGHRLDMPHRRALKAVASRRIANQSELRALDDWQDTWDPKAAEVFAMLPE